MSHVPSAPQAMFAVPNDLRALDLVKALSRFWLLVIAASLFATVLSAQTKTPMQEYVEAMQPGWNLGNTLDATPNETAWGNPLTTRELIKQIKAQGFKSIRIPVTWEPHMGPAPAYTIDPTWMNRVQQIVDWSLEEGLYVMLNVHHDSYWVLNMPTSHDAVLARFNAIWSQLAPRYRDYPRELMLESINEPQFSNVSDAQSMALLNELNTSFFHIVRNTGGGNATRPLVLPSLNTNSGQQYLDSLKATMTALNDTNLIATVHYYGFWPFSVNITGVTTVNEAVINDIVTSLDNTYNTFVAKGIPVVVGELGILSYNPNDGAVERGELLKFFEIYTAEAKARKITWQLWDAGNQFNRFTYQWRDPELFNYYIRGLTTRSSTASSDQVYVTSGAPADTTVSLNLNGNSFSSLSIGSKALIPGVDYSLSGSSLTLKSRLLASYSSGEYGEKAIVDVNFTAGLPWRLRIRHRAPTLLAEASGTEIDGLVIPANFRGDRVATMEARYVGKGSPFPGPASWTAFQEHTTTYVPDHINNTIKLKREFFAQNTNEPIDVKFHMWSGRNLNYRLTFENGGNIVTNPVKLQVYDEALATGWSDSASWAPRDLADMTQAHDGTKALSINAAGYGAVVLTYAGADLDTSAYKTLVFWVHGGTKGGQNFGVRLERGGDSSSPGFAIPAPKAATWTKVEVPLTTLGVDGSANIDRIVFQNWTNTEAPTLYIDNIYFTTAYASDLVFVYGKAAPALSSSIAPSAARGAAFSYTPVITGSPTSVTVSNLPSWLSRDQTTGEIRGTPPDAGRFSFTITATNAIGTMEEVVTVQVSPSPVSVSFIGGVGSSTPRFEVNYDGAPHSVAAESSLGGVPIVITYNGSPTPPTLPGTYQVIATTDAVNYLGSAEATLVITSSNPGRLVNLSIRATAGSGANSLIVGFVSTGGSGETPILVRGIGPTLENFSVTGVLADPHLTLYRGSTSVVVNDNWDTSLIPAFAASGAFALPGGSKDSAVALDLNSGNYTAHISGLEGSSGVALGEIYDRGPAFSPNVPVLVNASARCQVGTGADILIPGFSVGGGTPLRVLVRAVGPSLAQFGVTGLLNNPRITLYRSSTIVGENDNWDPLLAGTFAQAGAFALPFGSNDAALVAELAPGNYTAHVQGVDGTVGVALVEVYALPGW